MYRDTEKNSDALGLWKEFVVIEYAPSQINMF